MSIFRRFQTLLLAFMLLAGLSGLGVITFEKSFASSPPTMTWGSFTGSITGGGAVATIGTGVTGQRIIVQHYDVAATGAGIVVLYEKTSGGALLAINTTDCGAAATVQYNQNDYFGGSGYMTASGSSLVLLTPSTLTVTSNVRYLAN